MKNQSHVVIWGCPRSGTSIMLELFSSHPHFRYYFEPGIWILSDPWFQEQLATYRHALKNPYSYPKDQTPGLSGNVDQLIESIGDAHHIWIVRNPFDAVASLLPGMEGPGHPPTLPSVWSKRPTIDRSAALWRYWNETGIEELRRRSIEPHILRYEDLVFSTYQTVSEVLGFVEAQITPEVKHYVERVNNTPGINEAEFQARWMRPHTSHVGRWKETFSEAQIVTIQNIVGEVPTSYGYDLNPPS